jgi:hypothetical protein
MKEKTSPSEAPVGDRSLAAHSEAAVSERSSPALLPAQLAGEIRKILQVVSLICEFGSSAGDIEHSASGGRWRRSTAQF